MWSNKSQREAAEQEKPKNHAAVELKTYWQMCNTNTSLSGGCLENKYRYTEVSVDAFHHLKETSSLLAFTLKAAPTTTSNFPSAQRPNWARKTCTFSSRTTGRCRTPRARRLSQGQPHLETHAAAVKRAAAYLFTFRSVHLLSWAPAKAQQYLEKSSNLPHYTSLF